MIEYLDLDDLLEIARKAIGEDVAVGDYGLLESALARPQIGYYRDLIEEAARMAAALDLQVIELDWGRGLIARWDGDLDTALLVDAER